MPIPRHDEIGRGPERTGEHGIVGWIVNDGRRDDRGNDNGRQRCVAVEDLDGIQPAGSKLLGEPNPKGRTTLYR